MIPEHIAVLLYYYNNICEGSYWVPGSKYESMRVKHRFYSNAWILYLSMHVRRLATRWHYFHSFLGSFQCIIGWEKVCGKIL